MSQAKALSPTERVIGWRGSADLDFPYEAEVDGQRWTLRLNDFPAESLYTLFVAGEAKEDVESWPPAWERLG